MLRAMRLMLNDEQLPVTGFEKFRLNIWNKSIFDLLMWVHFLFNNFHAFTSLNELNELKSWPVTRDVDNGGISLCVHFLYQQ